jgi:Na+-translocating ferredoxin:NAD+ oxidoreductase RnfD subunit
MTPELRSVSGSPPHAAAADTLVTPTGAADARPRSPAAASAAAPPRVLGIDQRYAAPLLITLILIAAQLSFGVLEALPKTALCIVVAVAAEALLGRFLYGATPNLASAYVSGISCGILVRSPEWWPFVLAPLLSVTSKYVIRYGGRHLWNPSNLGIAVLLFLAPNTVASLSIQWGNTLWTLLVVWALGLFIVWRLRRLHICATYILSFVGYSLLRSVITGHPWAAEVAPITGPMYQLFTFFMITDPKTTVQSRRGQIAVAFLVATAECVLRLMGNVHAPYFALFLVGPTANLIDILRTRSRNAIGNRTAAGSPG